MVRLRSLLVLTTHGKWVQEFYEISFELFYTYDLEIYSGSFQDSRELIFIKIYQELWGRKS